jgi:RNA recognition motif-containing protein
MAAKTLYIGNLPWATTEDELRDLFSAHASVLGVRIVTDRQTGRSRGFGFVDVEEADAAAAIDALNGALVGGRSLVVTEAKSRQPF